MVDLSTCFPFSFNVIALSHYFLNMALFSLWNGKQKWFRRSWERLILKSYSLTTWLLREPWDSWMWPWAFSEFTWSRNPTKGRNACFYDSGRIRWVRQTVLQSPEWSALSAEILLESLQSPSPWLWPLPSPQGPAIYLLSYQKFHLLMHLEKMILNLRESLMVEFQAFPWVVLNGGGVGCPDSL